ncbi:PID-CTERM protein-sorting domain-containing protein [Marinoscillum furvescens]|uniref:Uncharacterized protein n=1 Tax=Marinoscillum furvescens DSM 4134 TaxID=1122208 RepID=A0A3D9L667_MARFU|nr:hypothetical protein [Marinoscillum furvescens]REE00468.1 hypothetical protein C7460_10589 [Marinoscillum furvescens DSM 4134]
MKTIVKPTGILIMLMVLCTLPLMAQGAPPKTPIDGGLSLLLAAGGAYGIRKVLKSRN